jgi:hypothetical protein
MGVHATFDPVNKLITVTDLPVDGYSTLDVQADLYSDAKEDWLSNTFFRNFTLPFRVIGGDDLGGGVKAGAYYFLRNDLGWKIRPYEADHELIITGNLYPNDIALPIFVPTLGDFTVSTRLSTSSLTQQVQSANYPTEVAAAVRADQATELANMDAAVSSRATQTSIDNMQVDIDALQTALAGTPQDVWENIITATFPDGSAGERLQQLLSTANFLALK